MASPNTRTIRFARGCCLTLLSGCGIFTGAGIGAPSAAPGPYAMTHTPSPTPTWFRAAIVIVGAVVFLASMILPEWIRLYVKHDRVSAVPRSGSAVVVVARPARPDEMGDPVPAQVTVRFHGTLVPAQKIVGFDRLRVGAPARIVYRIGRSGRIYVDQVSPIGPRL